MKYLRRKTCRDFTQARNRCLSPTAGCRLKTTQRDPQWPCTLVCIFAMQRYLELRRIFRRRKYVSVDMRSRRGFVHIVHGFRAKDIYQALILGCLPNREPSKQDSTALENTRFDFVDTITNELTDGGRVPPGLHNVER